MRQRAHAGRLLKDLGLSEHQTLLVAHNDTVHRHVHIMVNRVHPETLKTWDNKHDRRRIHQALRQIEFKMGWRLTPGRTDPLEKAPDGRAEMMRANARKIMLTAKDWRDLEERLQKQLGYTLRARGRGLVVTDGISYVKASSVDRSVSRAHLEQRFRMTYSDWRREVKEVQTLGRKYSRRVGPDLAWASSLKSSVRHPKNVQQRLHALDRTLRGDGNLKAMEQKMAAFAFRFGSHALKKISPPAATALAVARFTKRILDRARGRSR